jgi:signal transduction histidine kinase
LVAVLSVALAVPIGLLVHRAVQSTVLERELRHRTIAERVFDEMERALSEFLEREEARPVPGYADAEPSTPFVLGYFEIAPSGDVAVREKSTDAGTRAVVQGAAERLRALDSAAPAAAAPRDLARHAEAPARADAAAQVAGTTEQVAPQAGAKVAAPALKDERQAPAYQVLSSLNKAVSERAERKAKAQSDDDEADRMAEEPQKEGQKENEVGAVAKELATAGELPPMTGRALDAERLLLVRTVVRGTQAVRQGLVLDVGKLATFLRGRAIADEALATHAATTFATPFGGAAVPAADFVYRHRFADPFDGMSAQLALRALPGAGDARYVYALSVALLVAGGLGLLALYRMVGVTVAFAQRRSDFVAAVSHELKTPLTAIRMYGEMLRDGIVSSDAKRQEYYRHITAESERLSRLINNVLEFSRLEKGTRDVVLTTGSVEPVLREAVDLVRPHADAEGFALRLDVDDALPPVRFERDALLQVLFNLVDNAVKYARDGAERAITLRAEAAGGGVRLAVRDAGPGVPERHLAHVFEPFYRGERELTRRNRGTGLGLALVRGLVERMGGRIAGRNMAGGGFEVTIDLPRAA